MAAVYRSDGRIRERCDTVRRGRGHYAARHPAPAQRWPQSPHARFGGGFGVDFLERIRGLHSDIFILVVEEL